MRHRQRHVHRTIFTHLGNALAEGGWLSYPTPFGTTIVNIVDHQPLEAGETPQLNTVAISMGNQMEDLDHELGGGLTRRDYVLFVDIFGANESIGVALGDDLKDALTNRIIALRDYTTEAEGVETEDQLEFEHVIVETVPTATSTLDKRSWRVVKATVACYF